MYVNYLVIVPALQGDHYPVIGTFKEVLSYRNPSGEWYSISFAMDYYSLQSDAIHLKNWMVVPC